MDEQYQQKLAAYISSYINEEISRSKIIRIDQFLIRKAIDAFLGGAR